MNGRLNVVIDICSDELINQFQRLHLELEQGTITDIQRDSLSKVIASLLQIYLAKGIWALCDDLQESD